MIRVTDKSFRYTSSYDTDIKKRFRKMALAERAAATSSNTREAATFNSVVPMLARRSVPKT
jgi:hypothetical protein